MWFMKLAGMAGPGWRRPLPWDATLLAAEDLLEEHIEDPRGCKAEVRDRLRAIPRKQDLADADPVEARIA